MTPTVLSKIPALSQLMPNGWSAEQIVIAALRSPNFLIVVDT